MLCTLIEKPLLLGFVDAQKLVTVSSSKNNTFANEELHPKRLSNLIARTALGPIPWQRRERDGDRNYSELCVQRYKKILGNKLRSRNDTNQQQELLIRCSALNRLTQLGMPKSCRIS